MANGTPNGRPAGQPRAAGRGVDLSRVGLSDQEAREAQEMIEHQLLVRCDGCGRRIELGFRFTSIDVRASHPMLQLAACTRADCDFALKCREGATLLEVIEFAWLDENGVGAPPSVRVVKRNEQRARKAAAEESAES